MAAAHGRGAEEAGGYSDPLHGATTLGGTRWITLDLYGEIPEKQGKVVDTG